jgi:predicted Zn-dependent protease
VLYELATGEHPFRRKNQIVTINAILNRRPKRPSRIKPDLPPEFDAIISKSLAKDPAQRYQTAAELRDALWQLKSSIGSEPARSFSYHDLATGRRPAIEAVVAPRGPGTPSGSSRFRDWRIIVPLALVLLAVAVGALLIYPRRARGLTEKDTILLADFDNKTGDEVFDETLRQALVVDLGQSPFLNVLSDRKVTATLRLMSRRPDERVTGEIAREVCQRLGSKAMLAGSISSLGSSYVIGLDAVNCATGDSLVQEQVQARTKEDVLKALGNAATDLRGKLGESLASVQKFSTPIEEATTSSLEALKAYSVGRRVGYAKGDVAAIPYHQRALELDHSFALAYRALGVAYSNLGQATRSIENEKKAFELRERVSEREKYAIIARYYSDVTGELEKANQTYDLWKQSYPRDFLAPGNLGDNYLRTGQWEKALRETQDTIRLEPNSAVFNTNLIEIQLALNRPEEAKATVEQVMARKLDSNLLRVAMYEAAFVRGDQETMQQQLAWAAGRPGEEDWLLSTQSDTEAYFGRLAKAREFSQRAIESATRADAMEAAALWQLNAALREAEFGNPSSARQKALEAMALVPGRDVRSLAALALARAGDTVQAQKLAESLNKDFPLNTIVQRYWLPSIRAAIEMNSNNADKAMQILETARPFELCQSQPFQVGMLYPVYLRGQAHLLARHGKEGAAEFQKIIDHRGVVLNFPLGALAQLGLARAYALQGDTAKARAAFDRFFKLWESADADVPILQKAKAESASRSR